MLQKWSRRAGLVGLLLLSLALLGYGAWLLQLELAARAADRGELDAAAELYADAERRFPARFARSLAEHYSRAVFPQVALLYRRGKVDEAIGKLEQAAEIAPSLRERPEFGFWNGNALLRRAADTKDPDAIVKALRAAADHYRKALETAPDDWDLKYNYELVQYMLAQQELEQKKQKSTIKSILERIRTVTEPGEKEPPPPEKQG